MSDTDAVSTLRPFASPRFIEALREGRPISFGDFYEYAWLQLKSNPPRVLQSLTAAERDDLIADVILHCWDREQRVLRMYDDSGGSFLGWLKRVAFSKTVDSLRRQGRERRHVIPIRDGDVASREGSPDRLLISKENEELIRRCIGRLGVKCQILLAASSDGLRPREMCRLLGWSPDLNKKASDDLRHCRNRLKRELAREGVDWREILRDSL